MRNKLACLLLFISACTGPNKILAQESSLYPSLEAGTKAPAIKGKNENGKTVSLYKTKSRYTLLYFYEVHCHLCEVVTPKLKKLYESYHKLGLEVVAVPRESDRKEWKDYIADQGLTWMNIFPDQKSAALISTGYLLTVSPTIYILDREKKLLTRRLGKVDQVEEELNRLIR